MGEAEQPGETGGGALKWVLAVVALVLLLAGALLVLQSGARFRATAEEISWSEFLDHLKRRNVKSVTYTVGGRGYRGKYLPGMAHEGFVTTGPEPDAALRELIVKHAKLTIEAPSRLW